MQELEKLLQAGKDLTPAQVRDAAAFLLDPEPEAELKANFLRSLARKGESPAEITAFVGEFLQNALDPGIDVSKLPGPALDVVGTGGDKLSLFNISTTAMFILAAGGVCVVKHGNRGITSKSGGADVLEALGIKISLPPEDLGRCLQDNGLAFLFAPLYHPAFKAVVEARKILAKEGQRSIFNILGPLLNPVQPPCQLLGVFDPKLVPVFASILKDLGRKSAWVVHGSTGDGRGMDELSTLSTNHVASVDADGIREFTVEPAGLGFAPPALSELSGGDAAENAGLLEDILANRIQGPKRDMAVLNAAAGFVITGITPDLAAGRSLAENLINEGIAHSKLKDLQEWI